MAVKLTWMDHLKRRGVRDVLLVAAFFAVAIFLSFHGLSGWWGTKESSDRIQAEETAILAALDFYRNANQGYPAGSNAEISGLLLGKSGSGAKAFIDWNDRRIGPDNELLDVWGKPYLIAITDEHVFVTSGGPDGIIGTSDDRGVKTSLTRVSDSGAEAERTSSK